MSVKRPVNERLLPRHSAIKIVGMRPDDTAVSFIKRRRLQMMIFCYLTTAYSREAIPDKLAYIVQEAWPVWADQLVRVQKYHKGAVCYFDEVFKDWTVDKALELPHDSFIVSKAKKILALYS